MNLFQLEIESCLSDMLYLEREYQSFLRYEKLVKSDVVGNQAINRMVMIARDSARRYNRIFNIYPVPETVETKLYKFPAPRLVKN